VALPGMSRLSMFVLCLVPTLAIADSTLKTHKKSVNAVAVSRDGVVASAGDEGSLVVWNNGAVAATRESDAGPIHSIAFSPSGKLVALGTMYGQVAIWDRATNKDVFATKGHDGRITQVGFFPDGKTLVTVSIDQSVKLWEAATGKEKGKLVGPKYAYRALAVTADGKSLFSCDTNGGVTSWNLKTKKPTATHAASKGECHALALSADGKALAAGYGDGAIVVIDPATGKELRRAKASDSINSLAYSASGQIAAGTQSDELAIVDTAGAVTTRKGHGRPIISVAYAPDGSLVSGSMDMTVRVWK